MDTKFSVAVHVLILIAESHEPINSSRMAMSVGTNASYIRKVLTLLKRAGIIDSRRGVGGYALNVAPEQLTLLRIYSAVTDEPDMRILDIHQNPNDRCVVGHNIRPVLNDMFADAQRAFARSLADKTLADCIDGIRARMK